MRILFYDAVCPLPYDREVMAHRGLGGTEASLVRVAEGLALDGEVVVVAQRGRAQAHAPHSGLRYVPLEHRDPFDGAAPDWIVVLRKHRQVAALRARFADAQCILWLHNWQRPEAVLMRRSLVRSRCRVVTVSEAHRVQTDRLLNGSLLRGAGRIPVARIYNPVDESLAPEATGFDPDKLVFFSNKGVAQVLRAFAAVRRAMPMLRLVVAGNSLDEAMRRSRRIARLVRQPGVELLGQRPQAEIFRHVREALCVFYPQCVHPETFGLVFAESNALGTPVLAHDFGSAREVLGGADQLVDATDRQAIIERLRRWRAGERPRVRLRPEFKASRVVAAWRQLLAGLPYSHSIVAGGLEETS